MGLGDLFSLAKLTIESYADEKREGQPLATFTAQYNPETLSIHHESTFKSQPGPGHTSGAGGWSHSQPKRLTVNLIFDGTNVGYMGVELLLGGGTTVAQQLSDFLSACYQVNSDTHEPSHLKLYWGQAFGGFSGLGGGFAALGGAASALGGAQPPSFSCRLQSVDINYKTFNRDGSPLHAELAAVFLESLDPQKDAAQKKLNSPDLTHRRVVVDGDTLPLLCREIYGSAAHYVRVAQVNALDDFRNLTAGQELIFPPFERPRKG